MDPPRAAGEPRHVPEIGVDVRVESPPPQRIGRHHVVGDPGGAEDVVGMPRVVGRGEPELDARIAPEALVDRTKDRETHRRRGFEQHAPLGAAELRDRIVDAVERSDGRRAHAMVQRVVNKIPQRLRDGPSAACGGRRGPHRVPQGAQRLEPAIAQERRRVVRARAQIGSADRRRLRIGVARLQHPPFPEALVPELGVQAMPSLPDALLAVSEMPIAGRPAQRRHLIDHQLLAAVRFLDRAAHRSARPVDR